MSRDPLKNDINLKNIHKIFEIPLKKAYVCIKMCLLDLH